MALLYLNCMCGEDVSHKTCTSLIIYCIIINMSKCYTNGTVVLSYWNRLLIKDEE